MLEIVIQKYAHIQTQTCTGTHSEKSFSYKFCCVKAAQMKKTKNIEQNETNDTTISNSNNNNNNRARRLNWFSPFHSVLMGILPELSSLFVVVWCVVCTLYSVYIYMQKQSHSRSAEMIFPNDAKKYATKTGKRRSKINH